MRRYERELRRNGASSAGTAVGRIVKSNTAVTKDFSGGLSTKLVEGYRLMIRICADFRQ